MSCFDFVLVMKALVNFLMHTFWKDSKWTQCWLDPPLEIESVKFFPRVKLHEPRAVPATAQTPNLAGRRSGQPRLCSPLLAAAPALSAGAPHAVYKCCSAPCIDPKQQAHRYAAGRLTNSSVLGGSGRPRVRGRGAAAGASCGRKVGAQTAGEGGVSA